MAPARMHVRYHRDKTVACERALQHECELRVSIGRFFPQRLSANCTSLGKCIDAVREGQEGLVDASAILQGAPTVLRDRRAFRASQIDEVDLRVHSPRRRAAPRERPVALPLLLHALHGQRKNCVRAGGLRVCGRGFHGARVHAGLQIPERLLRVVHGRLGEVRHLHDALLRVLEDATGRAIVAILLHQQVPHHLIVNLQKGHVNLEDTFWGLRDDLAQASEHFGDGPENEAPLLGFSNAKHRVRLPSTSGAVDEHGCVPSCRKRLCNQGFPAPCVDFPLAGIRAEDVVKGTLLNAALLRRQELVTAGGSVLPNGDAACAGYLDDTVFSWWERPHAYSNADVPTASCAASSSGSSRSAPGLEDGVSSVGPAAFTEGEGRATTTSCGGRAKAAVLTTGRLGPIGT
mmetsp:Transcript_60242/g.168193  ORF Transcript_60242/g.168193 Transcript_60242/m.168193 type:complete len:404 (-) Transcript_60242:97-1308(-)